MPGFVRWVSLSYDRIESWRGRIALPTVGPVVSSVPLAPPRSRRGAANAAGDTPTEALAKKLQRAAAPLASDSGPLRRTRQAPLILVVDDDEGVREFAVAVLREAGYRVLDAETGHGAIMLFEENPDISLIFTDIVMPGLDGFKLADMIKFKRPEVRILYATAFLDEAREKLGVVHGQILLKPYFAAQLEQSVKDALR
jgi:CheY-like chemotaxis protein